jgi:hypothetical protein
MSGVFKPLAGIRCPIKNETPYEGEDVEQNKTCQIVLWDMYAP